MKSELNIEFSIWGIRDGFEKRGIIHSRNVAELSAYQQDRYRTLSRLSAGAGFFMQHRNKGYTMISFVNTKIRESITSDSIRRPGYVGFSLIFSDKLQLIHSPRLILKAISEFYVKCVGNGTQNNFELDDINKYLVGCTTQYRTGQVPFVSGSHYSFFDDESHIDLFLTGDASICNLSELILIPKAANADGKYLESIITDSAFGENPNYFDIENAKKKKQDEEKESQRLNQLKIDQALQQLETKNRQAQEAIDFENSIKLKLSTGKTEEAYKMWLNSPYKDAVSYETRLFLQNLEQGQNLIQIKVQNEKEDNDTFESLERALNNSKGDEAISLFDRLHNKNHSRVTNEIRGKITKIKDDLVRKKQELDAERQLSLENERKKETRQKVIIGGSIGLFVTGIVLSYFLMTPSFLWDADGDGFNNYFADECPKEAGKKLSGCPDSDKDGIKDSEDNCPKVKGTKDCDGCPDIDGDKVADSLDRCPMEKGDCDGCPCPTNDQTHTTASGDDISKLKENLSVKTPSSGDFQDQIFSGKWLRFSNKKYSYSDKESIDFIEIKTKNSIELLNRYYGLDGAVPTQQNTKYQPTKKSKLTEVEKKELEDLKALNRPLSDTERDRKATLENKSNQKK